LAPAISRIAELRSSIHGDASVACAGAPIEALSSVAIPQAANMTRIRLVIIFMAPDLNGKQALRH
jgi:hypothetical protein